MKLINTASALQDALEFIREQEILAFDTETTGLNVRKDAVIGIGFSSADTGYYLPLHSYNAATAALLPCPGASEYIGPVLQALSRKKLITWNASFDMRVTRNNLGVDLLSALHADVLLMKHTCDEEFPFGLKEVASKLFGTDVKKEKEEMQASIKTNGGATKEFYKADVALLARYCAQDCLLTFRLFHYYSNELKRQGLEAFYYNDEVLPLYKEVTIPMEDRGVRLDMRKLLSVQAELTTDLAALETQIQNAIAPQLGIFTTWFLNKDYPIKTTTGKPSAWTKKYNSQWEAWRADEPTGYMFNLLSKHHLKKLFFDTLKETPLSRTPTGQPQVDEEFIDSIKSKYPWAHLLTDFNKLTKLKGTYVDRLIEESENGRFYPSFMQHRTVSGRYAGDLQQLPRPLEHGQQSALVVKYNNHIREFIIADEGCALLSADYEQLEPSIFAHTSGDSALQQIFVTGLDFYSEVAIRTESLGSYSSSKSADNYLGRANKTARQKAKAYALGIAYGMTGYKLKFEIDVDERAAEQLVKDYLAAFPKLAEWMSASKEQARTFGEVRTQSGRIRHLKQAKKLYESYGPCIDDDLQLWKRFNSNPGAYAAAKEARKTYKNELNNAINFQVQGLAASIVNRAAIALSRKLKSEGLQASICMQIHDELVLNCPIGEKPKVSTIVQETMENIVTLAVPLRTVPQFGDNFRQCK